MATYKQYINGANFYLGDQNVGKIEEAHTTRFERNDVEAPDINSLEKLGNLNQTTKFTKEDCEMLENHMNKMIEERVNPKPIQRENLEDYLGSASVEAWEVL